MLVSLRHVTVVLTGTLPARSLTDWLTPLVSLMNRVRVQEMLNTVRVIAPTVHVIEMGSILSRTSTNFGGVDARHSSQAVNC